MKRVYSLILLLSLLVGTLQLILPMIEYQMQKDSISELLRAGSSHKAKQHQNLLDDDYYPLALEISTIHFSSTDNYTSTWRQLL
jgi:hypothetical protein